MACLTTTTVNGHCFTNGNACIDNTGFGTSVFVNMNSTSRYNTAVGVNALCNNTSQCRMRNTAVGYKANGFVVGGCLNGTVAIGACSAAVSNNAVAVGFRAQTGGYDSVAIGAQYTQADGSAAIAIGYCAVSNGALGILIGNRGIAEGSYSVVIGNQAKSCSALNTVIGSYAQSLNNGQCNTIIGYNSKVYDGSDNILVGGNNYVGGGVNNTIILGSYMSTNNSNFILFNCQYGSGPNYIYTKWSYLSDCRDKTNVQPLDYKLGLPLMKKLNPISFKWDLRSSYVKKCEYEFGTKDGSLKRDHLQVGILAQDLEQSINELNVRFDALKYVEDTDKYSVNESAFVSSLVKSIQQLSDRMDNIKNRIENLETV